MSRLLFSSKDILKVRPLTRKLVAPFRTEGTKANVK